MIAVVVVAIPDPVILTVSNGFTGSLLAKVNVVGYAPNVDGPNVTLTVQVRPGARVAPQVLAAT
jgi:hypothetical protein